MQWLYCKGGSAGVRGLGEADEVGGPAVLAARLEDGSPAVATEVQFSHLVSDVMYRMSGV